ncbi:MAG: TolC family protein [Magnetococcales bacterium]|nr:TolC family protein [Magnetococcales bacterium]MBF0149604.1 TolC family protein [Magnetococcales bacterium]
MMFPRLLRSVNFLAMPCFGHFHVRSLFRLGWVLLLPMMVGCALQPAPLARQELEHRVTLDLQSLFARVTPPEGPVTLEQAMARAVHHNLQQQVVRLEGALALGVNELAAYSMLPELQVTADHTARDRTTYLTQDRFQNSASLTAAWSVLDFGVSYLNARQKANGILIAQQQRRKAAQDLLFEVETAFGQAWVAQRLEASVQPLFIRIEKALENAREVERQGIQPVQESLDFQKKLLKILDQLQRLQRQVSGARPRLMELIHLDGVVKFPELQDPGFLLPLDVNHLPDVAELEQFALNNRPELMERHYQGRIQADEQRKEWLRLLPGLEVSSGHRYDNSGIYVNHHWAEQGVSLAWNLIRLVTGPDLVAQQRTERDLEEHRRLALAMTVMTQVRVSLMELGESKSGYETARALSKVDRRLFEHARAGREVATMSEAQLIEIEADLLLQEARRDLAHAELSSAAARLLVSLGLNRLPYGFDIMDTDQLTLALEEMTRRPRWATFTAFDTAEAADIGKPAQNSEHGNEKAGGPPGVPQSHDGVSSPSEKDEPVEPVWILEMPKAPVTPTVSPPSSERSSPEFPGVLLRVGAFASRDHAVKLYSRLEKKNYPVVLRPFSNATGRVIYQVSVGPIQEETQGKVLLETLKKQEGIEAVAVSLAPVS